jgi:hypothetical protein
MALVNFLLPPQRGFHKIGMVDWIDLVIRHRWKQVVLIVFRGGGAQQRVPVPKTLCYYYLWSLRLQ